MQLARYSDSVSLRKLQTLWHFSVNNFFTIIARDPSREYRDTSLMLFVTGDGILIRLARILRALIPTDITRAGSSMRCFRGMFDRNANRPLCRTAHQRAVEPRLMIKRPAIILSIKQQYAAVSSYIVVQWRLDRAAAAAALGGNARAPAFHVIVIKRRRCTARHRSRRSRAQIAKTRFNLEDWLAGGKLFNEYTRRVVGFRRRYAHRVYSRCPISSCESRSRSSLNIERSNICIAAKINFNTPFVGW